MEKKTVRRNGFTRSRFGKAASTYPCGVCGRRTRHTGVQSSGSDLCSQCWDLAGIENEVGDGHVPAAERRDEVVALVAEVVAKGGDVTGWADLLARVQVAPVTAADLLALESDTRALLARAGALAARYDSARLVAALGHLASASDELGQAATVRAATERTE